MVTSREKILLVQLFSNGDCLYATTVARQIKEDHPDCLLFWLVSDSCANILKHNPYIDEVRTVSGINYANWEQKWQEFQNILAITKRDIGADKVYFTQIIDENFANYDYCIRSTIFRGYDRPITVPIEPVLKLDETEVAAVEQFVQHHKLRSFSFVVIFEFAPRSGQAGFTAEKARSVAESMVKSDPSLAIIMSSNMKLDEGTQGIIDGSVLSLRETAHLAHYANLLVGCSSGITWVTTSQAGKRLPMIQLLDPNAYWFNSVKNDRERFEMDSNDVIEMSDDRIAELPSCINLIKAGHLARAKTEYHQNFPQSFRVSRGLIFYLLKKGYFGGILKHIRINVALFGWRWRLVRSIILAIVTFPVMVIKKKMDSLSRT